MNCHQLLPSSAALIAQVVKPGRPIWFSHDGEAHISPYDHPLVGLVWEGKSLSIIIAWTRWWIRLLSFVWLHMIHGLFFALYPRIRPRASTRLWQRSTRIWFQISWQTPSLEHEPKSNDVCLFHACVLVLWQDGSAFSAKDKKFIQWDKSGKQLVVACFEYDIIWSHETCFSFPHFLLIFFWFHSKVHEDDLVSHYDILKPYLIAFAGERLPSAQDHQAWKLGIWYV
jgi:hypothetical protein